MKLLGSISCLLVASLNILGTRADFSTASGRWEIERQIFPQDLQMTNDEGQLVDLTLSPEPVTNASDSERVNFRFYTGLNKDFPTVFITHGWLGSKKSQSCRLIAKAYLDHGGFNVIVVDWSSMSHSSYEMAAWQVVNVGRKVALMINILKDENKLIIENTILVGHSLGAHVMGIAGNTLGGAVKTIFGLDPAQPLFRLASIGWCLTNRDAKYVEIIVTNAGVLGTDQIYGHANFFINNGADQPNCEANVAFPCSHNRAYEVFAESINSQISFWGRNCEGRLYLAVGYYCGGSRTVVMGGAEPHTDSRGSYMVITNTSPPYAKGKLV